MGPFPPLPVYPTAICLYWWRVIDSPCTFSDSSPIPFALGCNAFYSEPDNTHLPDKRIRTLTRIAHEIKEHQIIAASQLTSWLQHSKDNTEQREFPYVIHGRALIVKDCLFRPFLCILLYSASAQPQVVWDLARRCLDMCFEDLEHVNSQHQHHGTWLSAHVAFRCALSIIAAVKSAKMSVRVDWRDFIVGAMETINFWGEEARDIKKLADIVDDKEFRTV